MGESTSAKDFETTLFEIRAQVDSPLKYGLIASEPRDSLHIWTILALVKHLCIIFLMHGQSAHPKKDAVPVDFKKCIY